MVRTLANCWSVVLAAQIVTFIRCLDPIVAELLVCSLLSLGLIPFVCVLRYLTGIPKFTESMQY